MFEEENRPIDGPPDNQPGIPRTARIRRRISPEGSAPPEGSQRIHHAPSPHGNLFDEQPSLFEEQPSLFEEPPALFKEAFAANPTPASSPPLPTLFDEAPGGPAGGQGLDELAQLMEAETPSQPQPTAKEPKKKAKATAKEVKASAGKAPKKEALPAKGSGATPTDEGGSPKKAPKKRKPRWRRITFKGVVLSLIALMLVGGALLTAFLFHATRNDDLWLDLDTIPYRTETVLYYTDRETGEALEYTRLPCTQNKQYLPGSEMPQHLKEAFVAVEDKNFYNHIGFDPKRTLFALANEVVHTVTGHYIGGDDGRKQGASTINQQLIKNLTRDDDDSSMAGYQRKLREVFRAIRMDSQYEKDDILSAYLNTISFTGNTAGVEAEAQKLFGVSASQLTLAQSASLAAITRNPSRYNPATNPEAHLERRNHVLALMLEQGYITQAEHDEAVAQPLSLMGNTEPPLERYVTDYFTDTVIDATINELVSQRGITRKEASNLIYNGGLRIYTTLVPQLQASMEKVMENATYHPRPNATVSKQLVGEDGKPMVDEAGKPVMGEVQVRPQGAMVSLDYDGGIVAIVGGLGEKEISRGFNRATSAVRQVGSTMKPIGPYVTALEDGWITWSTSFLDAPVTTIENKETGEKIDWPANASNQYSGKNILVHNALANSINTVAVRVGEEAGTRRIYQFVHDDLGISTLTPEDAAPGPLVLGSSTFGITPLEMAKAYAMFGNGGYTVTPHCFTRITGGTGTTILEVNAPKTRVISEETAFIMNRLMAEVLVSGTASGWRVPGQMDSVGKTGTTSDNRDHWFIGLTPYYVTASWYGYDENIPLSVDNRNHPPTLAWRAVMQAGQQGLPAIGFPESSDAVQLDFCTQSGYAAGPNCPSAKGWYKRWQPPQNGCPIHH